MILVDPARRPRSALEAWVMRAVPEYLRDLTSAPPDRMATEAMAVGELVSTLEWSAP